MGDPAELVCLLQYRVEYRCEIAGGGINDPQNFGGCGLQLQGLARLSKQSSVFHGDHGLRGEVLRQSNLLFRERPYLLSVNGEHAQQLGLLAQRHNEKGARTAKLDGGNAQPVARPVEFGFSNIRYMDETLSMQDAAKPGL